MNVNKEVIEFYNDLNPFLIPCLLDEIKVFYKLNGIKEECDKGLIKQKAKYLDLRLDDIFFDLSFTDIKIEDIIYIYYYKEIDSVYIIYTAGPLNMKTKYLYLQLVEIFDFRN